MGQVKIISIIARVTEECNLKCKYCHVNETDKGKVLSLDQFTKLVSGLAEIGYNHVVLYWHGGEPLILGIDYYTKIVEIENELSSKYNIRISNKVQSNGTLITRNWVDFFKINKFSVGISLDGNQEINDQNRVMANGKSAFDKAMRGINLMQAEGLDTSILSVFTSENLTGISEYYSFVKSIGVKSFKVNPCFINKNDYSELQVHPVEWGLAMVTLFDLWFHDSTPPYNREFYNTIKSFFTLRNYTCIFNQMCFSNYISVIPNGDLFPCARLINGSPEFRLGNINEGLESIITKYKLLTRHYENMGCESCKWQRICNGGCTASALWAHSTINAPDYLCEGYQILFQHMYDTVQQEITTNSNVP